MCSCKQAYMYWFKFTIGYANLFLVNIFLAVGSFLWTHVRNLAEEPGVSEYDQELARLASHPTLNSKFNTNPLRSSRNYRYSHFSEIVCDGAGISRPLMFNVREIMCMED